jgi:hypothetical protein
VVARIRERLFVQDVIRGPDAVRLVGDRVGEYNISCQRKSVLEKPIK